MSIGIRIFHEEPINIEKFKNGMPPTGGVQGLWKAYYTVLLALSSHGHRCIKVAFMWVKKHG